MLLLDYLPKFMKEIKEIQVIMNVFEPFIQNINSEIENLTNCMFILETNEEGIENYEKMLGIAPKLTESLERRRYRIFLKYNEKLPYTYKNLITMLDNICGEGNYLINLSTEKFLLIVRVNLKTKDLIETVAETLERVVPINICIDVALLYKTWGDLKGYRWGDLKSVSWGKIKEEEYDERNREL